MATRKAAAKKAVKKAPAKKTAPAAKKRAYKRKPKVEAQSAPIIDDTLNQATDGGENKSYVGQNDDVVDAAGFMDFHEFMQNMEANAQQEMLLSSDVIDISESTPQYRLSVLMWLTTLGAKFIDNNELKPVTDISFVNEILSDFAGGLIIDAAHNTVKLIAVDSRAMRQATKAVRIDGVITDIQLKVSYVGELAPSRVRLHGTNYRKVD